MRGLCIQLLAAVARAWLLSSAALQSGLGHVTCSGWWIFASVIDVSKDLANTRCLGTRLYLVLLLVHS